MNKIIGDHRRTFRHTLIGYWICTAFVAAGFLLGGLYVKMPFAVFAVTLTAAMTGLSLYSTLEIAVLAPKKFRKKLDGLPESEKNGIVLQYGSAPSLGGKHFLEEYLIFYENRKIILLKYSKIISAELKGFKLLLKTADGKTTKMSPGANENPAVIVAAMRSKNPHISAIVNGRVIERMENKK